MFIQLIVIFNCNCRTVCFIMESGSGAGSKKHLYVGGLAEEVDQKVLQAAFIPFGDIVEINMPIDYETEKHRGFAFIEFELAEDAQVQ